MRGIISPRLFFSHISTSLVQPIEKKGAGNWLRCRPFFVQITKSEIEKRIPFEFPGLNRIILVIVPFGPILSKLYSK